VFDVTVLWLSVQLLFEEAAPDFFARLAFGTLLFLSTVILVDYAAYPFGYRGGLIGNNQDILLNLMISRPHAFSSEPSYAASFLCLGLLTTGPYLLLRSRRRWLAALGIALVLFAVVATTSRSGWAALALGGGLLLALPVLAGRRLPWKRLLVGAAAAAALVVVFLLTTPKAQLQNLNDHLVSSVLHGNDSSGVSRLKAFGLAWDMARDTHGLGAGFGASYRYFKDHGGFDYNFQESFNARMYGNEVIMSAWGQLLAEGGLVGVLLYALAGVLLVRRLWRHWVATGSPLAYGSLTAAIVFFAFLGFFLGNICRGDMWVWLALWSGFAEKA
jgi:O-antigen ligase